LPARFSIARLRIATASMLPNASPIAAEQRLRVGALERPDGHQPNNNGCR
jgi:hypothetical protein